LARRASARVGPSFVSNLDDLRKFTKGGAGDKPYIGFGNPLLVGRDGKDRRAFAQDANSCRTVAPDGLAHVETATLNQGAPLSSPAAVRQRRRGSQAAPAARNDAGTLCGRGEPRSVTGRHSCGRPSDGSRGERNERLGPTSARARCPLRHACASSRRQHADRARID